MASSSPFPSTVSDEDKTKLHASPSTSIPYSAEQEGPSISLAQEYKELQDLLAQTYGYMYVCRFDEDDEVIDLMEDEVELEVKAAALEAQLADIEEEMLKEE